MSKADMEKTVIDLVFAALAFITSVGNTFLKALVLKSGWNWLVVPAFENIATINYFQSFMIVCALSTIAIKFMMPRLPSETDDPNRSATVAGAHFGVTLVLLFHWFALYMISLIVY